MHGRSCRPARCAFYADFFARAARAGIRLTPILSSPPAWARALLDANRTAFFAAWRAYADEAVALVVGAGALASVEAWQLWNEVSHCGALRRAAPHIAQHSLPYLVLACQNACSPIPRTARIEALSAPA